MQSQARVVIVGGGMMDVGLLYHLAEEGWKDVLLIEMSRIHQVGNLLYPKLEERTGLR